MSKGINYAFIDSQNLNLGIKSQGWQLDNRKFRIYLKNKYNIQKAYLFIGQVIGNEELYKHLKNMGYELVFKPTTEYKVDGKKTVKGNVDAELVLYAAAKIYNSYDKAVIVSGDGDFYCLAEYLQEKGKLLKIMTPNRKYSRLLKTFAEHIVRLDLVRYKLEYKKDQHPRSVETLGLSGHGDPKAIIANNGSKHKRYIKKSPSKDKTLKGSSSVRDDKIIAETGISRKPSIKGQK